MKIWTLNLCYEELYPAPLMYRSVPSTCIMKICTKHLYYTDLYPASVFWVYCAYLIWDHPTDKFSPNEAQWVPLWISIRNSTDLCGPVLPPGLVYLHTYLGSLPNKAQWGPLWTCPITRTGLPSTLPWNPPNKAQWGPLWTCPTAKSVLPSSLP